MKSLGFGGHRYFNLEVVNVSPGSLELRASTFKHYFILVIFVWFGFENNCSRLSIRMNSRYEFLKR
jgi:hypothetical protein